MRRLIAALTIFVLLLSLVGCNSEPKLSDSLSKLPVDTPVEPEPAEPIEPQPTDKPADAEPPTDTDDSDQAGETDKPTKPDKPSKENNAKPEESAKPKLSLKDFEGVFESELTEENDLGIVTTNLEIRAYDEFLMLEYTQMMDGSTYNFWAEEFWPNEDGLTEGEWPSVMGESQCFSSMALYGQYQDQAQNRCITLTEDGVVLNYDDADAEYYHSIEGFSTHTSPDQMLKDLNDHVETVYLEERLLGSWKGQNDQQTMYLRFNEDQSATVIVKTYGEPMVLMNGAWGISQSEGLLTLFVEAAGEDNYPHNIQMSWEIEYDGRLYLYDDYGYLFPYSDGAWFNPTDEQISLEVDPEKKLSFFWSYYDLADNYTDQYGTDYYYYFNLPQFVTDGDPVREAMNENIIDNFAYVIETELAAMEQGEFLSYEFVGWKYSIFDNILQLDITAEAYDWTLQMVYYYDMTTGQELYAADMLERLGISEQLFKDTVRKRAEEYYIAWNADIPEEEKENYGYYEMLEWTRSDDAVNTSLPIYVDRYGDIVVYTRIGTLAGAGEMIVPMGISFFE